MNIKQAKEQIENAVRAYLTKDKYGNYLIPPEKQRPIFLFGPPGIGKTAIMKQIARETGCGLLSYSMTHHTRQSVLGLPVIKHTEFEGEAYDYSEYTMSEIIAAIYDRMRESGVRTGILFLDEINCVSETLTPIMLQFLQYKEFGRHKVPDGWIIVTAGNPPEYNRSVREYDIATWDRLKRVDVEADFEAWKEFAYASGVHNVVLTYLGNSKNYAKRFYHIESTPDGIRFVTARGWDDLSKMIQIYEINNIAVTKTLVEQYIQDPEIAASFATYYDLYNKYRSDYQIPDILEDKADRDIEERARSAKFDERYAFLGLLLEAVMSDMKQVMDSWKVLDTVYGYLKTARDRVGTDVTLAERMLNESKKACHDEYEKAVKAHGVDDEQRLIDRRVCDFFDNAVRVLRMHDTPGEVAFDAVRALFNTAMEQQEKAAAKTAERTNNMYLFCERVFQRGQELAILTNELVSSPLSTKFLAKYEVPEFFKHNKSLLIEDRKAEIRTTITKFQL